MFFRVSLIGCNYSDIFSFFAGASIVVESSDTPSRKGNTCVYTLVTVVSSAPKCMRHGVLCVGMWHTSTALAAPRRLLPIGDGKSLRDPHRRLLLPQSAPPFPLRDCSHDSCILPLRRRPLANSRSCTRLWRRRARASRWRHATAVLRPAARASICTPALSVCIFSGATLRSRLRLPMPRNPPNTLALLTRVAPTTPTCRAQHCPPSRRRCHAFQQRASASAWRYRTFSPSARRHQRALQSPCFCLPSRLSHLKQLSCLNLSCVLRFTCILFAFINSLTSLIDSLQSTVYYSITADLYPYE